ncbi:UNVERIFIED_CONTAM: hypothetical protein Sradi_1508600 [Sesamum radiatum]|uniref:Uncharacterized protein n=1 Tax=Sesamum radiatum TaxID=300843 RepID=A0AAW2U7W7_SESRA
MTLLRSSNSSSDFELGLSSFSSARPSGMAIRGPSITVGTSSNRTDPDLANPVNSPNNSEEARIDASFHIRYSLKVKDIPKIRRNYHISRDYAIHIPST